RAVGCVFVTRASYAAMVRLAIARLARFRRARRAARARTSRPEPALVAVTLPETADAGEPSLPVVVEPAKARGRLMEQGLAWQETFDFGKGGAQAFQLPPVGLLKPPP